MKPMGRFQSCVFDFWWWAKTAVYMWRIWVFLQHRPEQHPCDHRMILKVTSVKKQWEKEENNDSWSEERDLCFTHTHSHMLEDVTLHTSHRCTELPTFPSPGCVCWQEWDIMRSIIPQEHALRQNQTSTEQERRQRRKLCLGDHNAVSPCSTYSSWALQFGDQDAWNAAVYQFLANWAKRHWNSSQCLSLSPPPSLSLFLSLSICLFLPLLTQSALQTTTQVQSQ